MTRTRLLQELRLPRHGIHPEPPTLERVASTLELGDGTNGVENDSGDLSF